MFSSSWLRWGSGPFTSATTLSNCLNQITSNSFYNVTAKNWQKIPAGWKIVQKSIHHAPWDGSVGLCQAACELLHAIRGTCGTHTHSPTHPPTHTLPLSACCRAEAQPCEKALGLEMLGGSALLFGVARLLSLPACLEHQNELLVFVHFFPLKTGRYLVRAKC